MKKALLFLIISHLFSFVSYAKNSPFILKNELKEKFEMLQDTPDANYIRTGDYQELSHFIKQMIFSQESQNAIFSPPDNLYSYIQSQLGTDYLKTGKEEIKNVLLENKTFDLGMVNSNGFTWQKPMGFVDLKVDRRVQQNFERSDSPWMVTDIHTIKINARTFLEKLIKLNFLEISGGGALDAYADLNYARVFKFTHYHQSYEEALKSDLKKLYLPFIFVEQLNLAPLDELSLQDIFSLNAGASLDVNWSPYASFGASIKGGYDLFRLSTLKRTLGNDILLKKEKSEDFSFGFDLNLKLNLMNLLKLTILDFGFYGSIEKNLEETYVIKPGLVSQSTISKYFNFFPLGRSEKKGLLTQKEFSRKSSNTKNGFSFNFFGLSHEGDQSLESTQYDSVDKKFLLVKQASSGKKTSKTFWGYFKSSVLKELLGFTIDFNLTNSQKYTFESEYLLLAHEESYHKMYRREYQRVEKKKDFYKVASIIENDTGLSSKLPLRTVLSKFRKFLINEQNIYFSKETLSFLKNSASVTNSIKDICLEQKRARRCKRRLNNALKKFKKSKSVSSDLKNFHKFINQFFKLKLKIHDLPYLLKSINVKIEGRVSGYLKETRVNLDYSIGNFKKESKREEIEALLLK